MKRMSRAGRKQQAYEILMALQKCLTVYQIAPLMHMSRSTKLQKMLDEMVADGVLISFKTQHRPNSVKTCYRVPDEDDYLLHGMKGLEQLELWAK